MPTPDRGREITLRTRRQITLPAQACQALGLETGDRLEVLVADDALVFRPKRSAALEALRAIRQAFAESDLSEDELHKAGQHARERLTDAKHGEE